MDHDPDDVQNRMADAPELSSLRATSEKPSWLSRRARSLLLAVRSRTGLTILLALAIMATLGVFFWVGS
ncbi:MAG: hypothetical protein U9N56_06650 [Actinomycetota bacterium]|nr:hypothetical protein [Actinomycetota bacterium]